jgi:DNA-directed RNA polymerase II subunit RPB2
LPFNIEGIAPDIVINPHCIPSRMTIGHMIECLASKVACFNGKIGNATPFSALTITDVADKLHDFGY